MEPLSCSSELHFLDMKNYAAQNVAHKIVDFRTKAHL